MNNGENTAIEMSYGAVHTEVERDLPVKALGCAGAVIPWHWSGKTCDITDGFWGTADQNRFGYETHHWQVSAVRYLTPFICLGIVFITYSKKCAKC
jgi:hypothetical protein